MTDENAQDGASLNNVQVTALVMLLLLKGITLTDEEIQIIRDKPFEEWPEDLLDKAGPYLPA